jgi:hypothetical protein
MFTSFQFSFLRASLARYSLKLSFKTGGTDLIQSNLVFARQHRALLSLLSAASLQDVVVPVFFKER